LRPKEKKPENAVVKESPTSTKAALPFCFWQYVLTTTTTWWKKVRRAQQVFYTKKIEIKTEVDKGESGPGEKKPPIVFVFSRHNSGRVVS
jgi:hypothetical protein